MNAGNDTLNPAVREARLTERLDELKSALASVEAPAGLEALLAAIRAGRRCALY